MSSPDRPSRTGLWLALVLVLSFGAYAPALLNGFTFDDAVYVKAQTQAGVPNPMVAELRPLPEYFERPMNDGVSYTRGYRPVTVYSYALVHHLSRTKLSSTALGDEWSDPAWPQHLVNLLLHVLATALVFTLVRRFAPAGPALVAALVFGVHALHTEAIAWIVGRAEVFAFVFGLAGTLMYGAALSRRGAMRSWRLAVAALLFFVCFGSKESGVTWAGFAPLVALGFALRQQPGVRWLGNLRTQAWPWLAAVGIPLALFLWLRHRMLVAHIEPFGPYLIPFDHNPLFYLSAVERWPSAVMLLGYGLYKSLLPLSLSCSYREAVFDLPSTWLDLRVVAAVAVLAGAMFVAVVSGARHPLVLLGVGGFACLSFVTSNIPFGVETVFSERSYYAATVGVALLAAWVAMRTEGRRRRIAVAVPFAVWVIFCTAKSIERSFEWRDELALFTADLQEQPRSIDLHCNLAEQKLRNFGAVEAQALLRRAVEIEPESTQALIQLASYLTNSSAQLKNGPLAERAREELEEARDLVRRVEASPRYIPEVDGRSVHVLLSRYHRELGQMDEFYSHVERGLAFDPRDVRLRLALIGRARELGDAARVEELLAEGERYRPHCPYLAMERGNQAFDAGRFGAAAEAYAASLPDLPSQAVVIEAWGRYARCLAAVGRSGEGAMIAAHCLQMGLPDELRASFEAVLAPGPGR